MKSSLLLFLVLLGFGATPHAQRVHVTATPAQVKVMTFNICGAACPVNSGGLAVARVVVEKVRRHGLDVALLQEVCYRQYAEMRRLLPRGYTGTFTRTTTARRCGGAYGLAILVRGTLAHRQVVSLPVAAGTEPRAALAAEATIAGRRLWVASTQTSVRGNRDQLRRIAALLAARRGPYVLGGDLNATSASRDLRALVRASTELDVSAAPTFDPCVAARMRGSKAPCTAPAVKLDYLLVRSGSVGRSSTAASAVSDHRTYYGQFAL